MKQRLLFLLSVFYVIHSNAQIPTNGLIKDYKFTNGALTSDVNPVLQAGTTSLTPTGSNRLTMIDRNNEINKAILLNGDWFSAGGTKAAAVTNFAVSFWIKTGSFDTTKRYIFDQFVQTNPCGWSLALRNGQIVANGQSNYNIDSFYTIGLVAELSSPSVIDNTWHHIVFQVKNAITTNWDGAFTHNNDVITYELYVDSVLQASTVKNLNGAYTPSQSFTRRSMNASQPLYIGKSTDTANTDIYTENLDQVRYYETNLSQTEINILYAEDKPLTPLYVNVNATGANNGTSWANAYTSLETAIANYTLDKEIWVASGTYKPSGTVRTASFNLPSNLKMYGGFNGTEILKSERNPKVNLSILSGDLSNNDNTNITATEATRQDNSYHVITLRGNSKDIEVDGFVISGGNANGPTLTTGTASAQYYHARAGAIYVNTYNGNDDLRATFKNCTIEKNSASNAGVFAGYYASGVNNQSYEVNFTSCVIKNNYSGGLGAMLYSGANGFFWYAKGKMVNCLFNNNTNTSGASCIYLAASTANSGTPLGLDTSIVNCTFSNNTGTSGYVISGDNADNSKLYNSIIYGNGSITPLQYINGLPINSNNILEGAQLAGSNNNNPLFDSNYRLTNGSPAINAGNNIYVPVDITLDLDGNARIYNGTVDLGVQEYDATLHIFNQEDNLINFSIYPNPSHDIVKIQTDENIETVEVISLDGKKIQSSNSSSVDISDCPNGLYLLTIKTSDGKIGVEKLIKQ